MAGGANDPFEIRLDTGGDMEAVLVAGSARGSRDPLVLRKYPAGDVASLGAKVLNGGTIEVDVVDSGEGLSTTLLGSPRVSW